jgi:hypothetical protein
VQQENGKLWEEVRRVKPIQRDQEVNTDLRFDQIVVKDLIRQVRDGSPSPAPVIGVNLMRINRLNSVPHHNFDR